MMHYTSYPHGNICKKYQKGKLTCSGTPHRVPGYFRGLGQRVAQFLPLAKSTVQRTHPLNAQFLQLLRHTGAGRFARSRAVEDDLLVLGQLIGVAGDVVGQNADGAGQRPRIGERIERMPQVEDHQLLP